MIFDIKLRTLHEKRIQFPIAAPLPIMPYYFDSEGQKKPVSDICMLISFHSIALHFIAFHCIA